ncbi:hypothetical protein C8R44DRAFT_890037 [Mycena epipterygia]|nr:hypothetical protein C8R44DRAFT_890037 [Mycena epipterygia]
MSLIDLLKSLPTLTHLTIEVVEWDKQVFEAMAVSDTTSDLCPNLITFAYGYRHLLPPPTDALFALFALVQSRFRLRLSFFRLFRLLRSEPVQSNEFFTHGMRLLSD